MVPPFQYQAASTAPSARTSAVLNVTVTSSVVGSWEDEDEELDDELDEAAEEVVLDSAVDEVALLEDELVAGSLESPSVEDTMELLPQAARANVAASTSKKMDLRMVDNLLKASNWPR